MVKEEKGLLLEFAVQQRSKGRSKWHLGLLSLTKASLLSCGNTADGCVDMFLSLKWFGKKWTGIQVIEILVICFYLVIYHVDSAVSSFLSVCVFSLI